MSRIEETFTRLRREGRRGFIPFITAGDPDKQATRRLIVELARAGASVVELGVPFSDPVADGPTIQRSSERALVQNTSVVDVLSIVADARLETDVPVVLFSYYNPLMRLGVDALAEKAAAAGVDGILVTDLVPEESGEFSVALSKHGLDQIFLVAPTSSDKRIALVAERASGFIYAVSRAGVTGARTELSTEAEKLVARVRAASDLPVAVGFGISTKEQVADVWRYADAAVVGSAIVSEIEKRSSDAPGLVAHVGRFARALLPV